MVDQPTTDVDTSGEACSDANASIIIMKHHTGEARRTSEETLLVL